MNNKSKALLNNASIFIIGSIGTKFIQFFLVPLYTYTLTATQFGITEVVLTAVGLLMPFFSISIADGLLRFGLDTQYKKADVVKVSLVIVLIGTLLSFVARPLLGQFETLGTWYWYFFWILNLRIYRDVFAINLKIHDRNKLFAVDSLVYTLVLCVANIICLVWLAMGIEGYFISHIIANVWSIIFLCITGQVGTVLRQGKFDRALFKSLMIYSLPLIINGISWWITNAADRFMLEWLMTTRAVGIYAAATKLPTLVTTFTGVFSQAWIISAVQEYDGERETKFYSAVFHKYYVLLFVAVSGLISVLQPFMSIYVGPDFRSSWLYTPLLVASAALSGSAAFMVGIYASTKKNMNVTMTTLLGGVGNIALNYLLIPTLGIMGAVVSTYISWGLVLFVRLWDIRKFFSFHVDAKKFGSLVVLLTIQCVTVTALPLGWSLLVSSIIILTMLLLERQLFTELWHFVKGKIKR